MVLVVELAIDHADGVGRLGELEEALVAGREPSISFATNLPSAAPLSASGASIPFVMTSSTFEPPGFRRLDFSMF